MLKFLVAAKKRLGSSKTIVMPALRPEVPRYPCRIHGAEVVFICDALDERLQNPLKIVARQFRSDVHPLDDLDTISDKASMAWTSINYEGIRMLIFNTIYWWWFNRRCICLHQIILRPDIKNYRVEKPVEAAWFKKSCLGKRVADSLAQVGIFAEGSRVSGKL